MTRQACADSWVRAGAVALCLLGALTTAVLPAKSQNRQLKGTVELRAPRIVNGYYVEVKQQICKDLSYCTASFSAVPIGKFLIVTYVSCSLSTIGTAQMKYFFIASPTRALKPPTQLATRLGVVYLQSSEELKAMFQARNAPVVSVNWGSSIDSTLYCKIGGMLRSAL